MERRGSENREDGAPTSGPEIPGVGDGGRLCTRQKERASTSGDSQLIRSGAASRYGISLSVTVPP